MSYLLVLLQLSIGAGTFSILQHLCYTIEQELAIIRSIDQNATITIKELVDTLQLSIKQVRTILDMLKKNGVLERVGPTKSGYWKVVRPSMDWKGIEKA